MMKYVITLSVASRGMTEIDDLIAIGIDLENCEFPYIETEKSILCLNQTRKY
jgi:hypothetical protein